MLEPDVVEESNKSSEAENGGNMLFLIKNSDEAAAAWKSFLIAKPSKLEKFIAKYDGILDFELASSHFDEIQQGLRAKSSWGQLVSLLQQGKTMSPACRAVVIGVVEAALGSLDRLLLPSPDDDEDFADGLRAWLKKGKLPLAKGNLDAFMCSLIYGRQKHLIENIAASELLILAMLGDKASDGSVNPFDVIFDLTVKGDVLSSSMRLHRAWLRSFLRERRRVSDLKEENRLIRESLSKLESEFEQLKGNVSDLRSERKKLLQEVSEERAQNDRIHNTYRDSINELKSRVRGLLTGSVRTWLLTAQDALRATPPRTRVIEERLESTLAAIERESECLLPLD